MPIDGRRIPIVVASLASLVATVRRMLMNKRSSPPTIEGIERTEIREFHLLAGDTFDGGMAE